MRGPSRRSKYNAVRTVLDGHQFASRKEARRYAELVLLEKAGQIARLQLQRPFPLLAVETDIEGVVRWDDVTAGDVGVYVSDFCYDELSADATRFVVEDVKGFKTPLYRWKKRHMKAQYGITVREV